MRKDELDGAVAAARPGGGGVVGGRCWNSASDMATMVADHMGDSGCVHIFLFNGSRTSYSSSALNPHGDVHEGS